ncbi:hypothetical protein H5410_027867 [Solanum commersonii]|uniref:NADH:quinone oxidoreductase/Mrp antiporter transmembrane domain-containing protein n=1 Tax=Solanum commersonii TaxID=4109 RepID=A0A9J5Z3B4_SOLCO|nr:hypothetical protein H5410_027867 [Solanum commersonii]
MGNLLTRFGEHWIRIRSLPPHHCMQWKLARFADWSESLVHLYSISCMSEELHSPRFMCYLSISTFFYVNADKVAIKAMLVNRVGYFGLALGMLGCFTLFQTVDFSIIFARALASAPKNSWISCNMRLNAITIIYILLFISAIGKSAQIGSHT